MRKGETERQMVDRHIAQGRENIARQIEIIRKLGLQGYPTAGAERLLATFEQAQRLHEAHLARISNSN
jgi:hypothetical protein